MKLKNIGKSAKRWFRTKGGTTLAITSVVGTCATMVTTTIASFKAKEALDNAANEKGEPLTVPEKLKVAAPFYIWPGVSGIATIGSALGSNLANKEHQKALTAATVGLTNALTYYEAKYTDGKNATVYGKCDHVVDTGVFKPSGEEREIDENIKRLYFEPFTGAYIRKTEFEMLNAQYMINKELNECGLVTLNDFLYWLGIEAKELGDELLWDVNVLSDRYSTDWIQLFYIQEERKDGTIFLSINYEVPPIARDTL